MPLYASVGVVIQIAKVDNGWIVFWNREVKESDPPEIARTYGKVKMKILCPTEDALTATITRASQEAIYV